MVRHEDGRFLFSFNIGRIVMAIKSFFSNIFYSVVYLFNKDSKLIPEEWKNAKMHGKKNEKKKGKIHSETFIDEFGNKWDPKTLNSMDPDLVNVLMGK